MQSGFIEKLKGHLRQQREQGNDLILTAAECAGVVHAPNFMPEEVITISTKLIKQAEKEVLIMGYKLNAYGDAREELISALRYLDEKAKQNGRPIRVRILIDTLNSLPNFIYRAGRDPEQFRTIDFPQLDFQYAQHNHVAFGTYHSKQIIIDGKVVILNSGDFSKDKNYKNGELTCIDIGTVLEGKEVATLVREDFRHAWSSQNSSPLSGAKKPIPEKLEKGTSNIILREEAISENQMPMLYLSKRADGYPITSHLSPTVLALIFAIEKAENSISIMTPNLNIPEVIEALAAANARRVTVNLIMSPRMNKNPQSLPFGGGHNEKTVKKLFAAVRQHKNCDLSKLHVRWNVDNNNKIVLTEDAINGPLPIHAKFACIDNQIVIAGSSPLDLQANRSRESDVCIDSPEVAEVYLNKIFSPIFDRGAEVYVDQEGKLMFTVQEVLEKIAGISESFIALLAHKKQSCNDAGENIKEAVIENILGSNGINDGTLYELKERTTKLLTKNSQQITPTEIDNLMDCYQKITQKIHETHLAESDFVKTQGVFYQVKTFFSDIVRKFLNLNDDLEFAKNLTTHSLMNHLSEELAKNDQCLQSISPSR